MTPEQQFISAIANSIRAEIKSQIDEPAELFEPIAPSF